MTASFTGGVSQAGQGDVMASFSSRGPVGLFIKPDLTAPGVQILAGMTPTPDETLLGPPGQYYQAIAGTSMSSPHVAGAAILLMDKHPSWTPGQVKSALMTTATTKVVKEDLTTPADPFDFGAGRIVVADASAAKLTFDETAENYAALAGDPLKAVNLNVPSIDAPVMPGKLVTWRTVKNVTRSKVEFSLKGIAPAGSTIKIEPSSIKVAPGKSKTFKVTITSDAPIGAQQFGQIVLKEKVKRGHKGQTLHLPVAFIHQQGIVATEPVLPAHDRPQERHHDLRCRGHQPRLRPAGGRPQVDHRLEVRHRQRRRRDEARQRRGSSRQRHARRSDARRAVPRTTRLRGLPPARHLRDHADPDR